MYENGIQSVGGWDRVGRINQGVLKDRGWRSKLMLLLPGVRWTFKNTAGDQYPRGDLSVDNISPSLLQRWTRLILTLIKHHTFIRQINVLDGTRKQTFGQNLSSSNSINFNKEINEIKKVTSVTWFVRISRKTFVGFTETKKRLRNPYRRQTSNHVKHG